MKHIILFLFALMTVTGIQAQRYYGRVKDSDGYANIRVSASNKSTVKMRIKSGSKIYYTPSDNGWSRVYVGKSSDSYLGYMHTSRIVNVDGKNKTNNKTKTTTSTRINNNKGNTDNVRTKNTSDDVLKLGYITDPTDNYVNIRKGPGTNYAVCGQLLVGSSIHYRSYNSGWVKVYEYERFLGYVAKSRIR